MTLGPKSKKKPLKTSKSVKTSIPRERLVELLKMVAIENVQGMSPDMVDALKENGIHYIDSVSSIDPLEVYDELKAAPKSSLDVEKNWTDITYRHLILNGLNLLTMNLRMNVLLHKFHHVADPLDANALCPPNLLVNPQNGITRLTALILVQAGYKRSIKLGVFLSGRTALERYQDATGFWDLSKAEGAEYYRSLVIAKWMIEKRPESETGPSNPRWPL